MIGSLPPGSVLLLGALLVPFLRGRLRQGWLLALPLLSLAHLLQFGEGQLVQLQFMDYELTPIRVDKLSLVFGYVFHFAALLGVLFSLHIKDRVEHVAALTYIGAAIGATFAGDLMTLFVYWELTAITSVFIVWARRTERAYRCGMRYLIIQVGSGVLLLAGILVYSNASGSIAFDHFQLGTPGSWLILLAFGIKCAFPLLHNWLADAYPEASPTGTVFLSAFTTKLAIYALARGFAGTEILIWIGVVMVIFPLFFAAIENDLRRLLAYCLNNQLGFMVIGVGLGSQMALNGVAAHAFAHILYKLLLFMSMGAVLHRAGSAKASELGGLYKSMPWTTGFAMIGAMSISAPLFCGFVSKSMILTSTAEAHLTSVYLVLVFGSAGVFCLAGIKLTYTAFFSQDSGIRCKEAPLNMLLAMGSTALLCVAVGCFPNALYDILPYEVDYKPYTTSHVMTQLQLLCFSALAFFVLKRTGLYPPELASVNLDTDWLYRRMLPRAYDGLVNVAASTRERVIGTSLRGIENLTEQIYRHYGPGGFFSRTWPTGTTVLWVAIILGAFLLAYFI